MDVNKTQSWLVPILGDQKQAVGGQLTAVLDWISLEKKVFVNNDLTHWLSPCFYDKSTLWLSAVICERWRKTGGSIGQRNRLAFVPLMQRKVVQSPANHWSTTTDSCLPINIAETAINISIIFCITQSLVQSMELAKRKRNVIYLPSREDIMTYIKMEDAFKMLEFIHLYLHFPLLLMEFGHPPSIQ